MSCAKISSEKKFIIFASNNCWNFVKNSHINDDEKKSILSIMTSGNGYERTQKKMIIFYLCLITSIIAFLLLLSLSMLLLVVIRLIFCCYFPAQRANPSHNENHEKWADFLLFIFSCSVRLTASHSESRGHSSHTQHGRLSWFCCVLCVVWFQLSKSSDLIIPMSFCSVVLSSSFNFSFFHFYCY